MDFLSCVKPQKSLIWPGKTALLWAQEAKGMSSAASSPHWFWSVSVPAMRFARHWPFVLLLFFIGRFGWTSPFFPNSNFKGCLTSRCRFVFRPQWDGELVTPYWDFLALNLSESRPGSRRSNNRRGAPQYTIARSNWESYYTAPWGQLQFTKPRFISCSDCGLVQGYWVDGWCIRLDPIFRSMHSHPSRNWKGKLRVRCTENCLRSPKQTYSWQPSGRPTTYNASHYSHWG